MKSTAGREGRQAAGILAAGSPAAVLHPHVGNESGQLISSWELPSHLGIHLVGSDVRPGSLLSAPVALLTRRKRCLK